MRSLRTRLILIFASMLIMTVGIICITNVVLLPAFYENSKVNQMQGAYFQTVRACESVEWNTITKETKDKVYDRLDVIGSNANVSVYIVQVKVYPGSGDIAELSYVYPAQSERLEQVTKGQLGKYVKAMFFDEKLDENCEILRQTNNHALYKVYDERVDSMFIELTGSMPGGYWVYLRSNYQSIQESSAVANQFLFYMGIIIVILGIFVMLIVGNQYTKPILYLAHHAQNMQELNFSKRYEGNRADEIGVLGSSMNALSDKLESTISELKTANNELQLDLQRRSEQEKMRQEFLANVSHELKTPIALIQGYAEGLQENINDDAESREFYCEVIVDEADKMNKMVKKLLSLNQLEFGNEPVHLEHFDLNDVIQSVIQSTDILFKQEGVKLLYQQNEEPLMVWADEYMVEEVVTNYVSNALNHVKYDKVIEIKTEMHESTIWVSVFNTGDPIPEEDIDKIWSKFYKVDKARTREYGGNGIGLSIVKAVMDAHNQKYGVRNYDNGVEFWFELDRKVLLDDGVL